MAFVGVAILVSCLLCVVSAEKTCNFTLGRFQISCSALNPGPPPQSFNLTVVHETRPEVPAWSVTLRPSSGKGSPQRSFVGASAGTFAVRTDSGNFEFTDTPSPRSALQTVDEVVPRLCLLGRCASVAVSGRLLDGPAGKLLANYTVRLRHPTLLLPDTLPVELDLLPVAEELAVPSSGARIFLAWDALPEENFFGLGEQFSVHGLRGLVVPVVTTEQGVGRGLQPVSTFVNAGSPLHNAAGDWSTTYSAIPHFVSSRCRSVSVRDSRYLELDLCSGSKSASDAIELMVLVGDETPPGEPWRTSIDVLHGTAPLDVVREYTAAVGRMEPLPDWVNAGGAVVGWEGGTATAEQVVDELLDAGAMVSALWLQDWTGVRRDAFGQRLWWNWELDEDSYEDWAGMVANLSAKGVRVTTYINPYLSNDVAASKPHVRDLWAEAAVAGYLVKNSSGLPYIQSSASATFTFSTIDLTSPDARNWYKRVMRCNMLGDQSGCDGNATAIGGAHSGWMADFGEYLPFDAVLASGEAASSVHNEFPELWSSTCREAIREAGREGDIVFWSRSASRRSPASSTLFWAGDQLTSWDNYDGLPSALHGMLSGGLSGLALTHSDIGGYTEFNAKVYRITRSEELLMRWMELEAFSGAIFRTHPGLKPSQAAQVNTDNATLQHFALFSSVHAALAPYRTLLMQEAAMRGAPLARYMFLEFPEQAASWTVADAFMLGSEFLVAPVLAKNASSVDVHFPTGAKWRHVWTGEVYSSKNASLAQNVEAPLGQPPLFLRLRPSGDLGGLLEGGILARAVAGAVAKRLATLWQEKFA